MKRPSVPVVMWQVCQRILDVKCMGLIVALVTGATAAKERQEFGRNYFRNEYTLDYYIATYPKPMIAIMDGITSPLAYFALEAYW